MRRVCMGEYSCRVEPLGHVEIAGRMEIKRD